MLETYNTAIRYQGTPPATYHSGNYGNNVEAEIHAGTGFFAAKANLDENPYGNFHTTKYNYNSKNSKITYNPILEEINPKKAPETEQAIQNTETAVDTSRNGTTATADREAGFWGTLGNCGWNFLKGGTLGFIKNTLKEMFCNPDGSLSGWNTIKSIAMIAGTSALAIGIGGFAAPLILGGIAAYGVITSGFSLAQNLGSIAKHLYKGEYADAQMESIDAGQNTTELILNCVSLRAFLSRAKKQLIAAKGAETALPKLI